MQEMDGSQMVAVTRGGAGADGQGHVGPTGSDISGYDEFLNTILVEDGPDQSVSRLMW